MTSQVPEASQIITLSPKKKTEKVLPMNNPQIGNPGVNQGTENSKPSISGKFIRKIIH